MLIAWTTVALRADAERLAREIIGRGLAVCVQIEGPIESTYRWENKVEVATEFRLMIKLLAPQIAELRGWVLSHHPYDTPEWVVISASDVGEKYLSWARANSTNPPL